jgi:hypothetical protein
MRLTLPYSSARRFGAEPGVLLLNDQGKRSSPTGRALIRVPESVYNRVINQMKRL